MIRSKEMKNLKEINDANFVDEVLKNPKPVLIDFWAPWCGPCRVMGPEVEKAANEFGNDVIVGKVKIGRAHV
jgi:thioredoxin 1